MTTRYLEYQPVDGYLHHWLVAGPQTLNSPFSFPPEFQLGEEAIDREKVTLHGAELTWKYFRCMDDHLVDLSYFASVPQSTLAFATTQLVAAQPGAARLALSAFGPAELWLNGQRVAAIETGDNNFVTAKHQSVDVTLAAENTLSVRFAQNGARGLALAFAVRVEEHTGELTVRTGTKTRFPRRHYLFEKAFDQAFLENVNHYRGAHFNLHFSQGIGSDLTYAYHVMDKDAMIYVEGSGPVDPNEVNDVGHTVRLFERPYFVTLRAPGREYWEQDLRYEVRLPIYVVDNDFSVSTGGDYNTRREEALNTAAKRDGLVFAQLARMELDKWDEVEPAALDEAMARVARQEAGSDLDLLGLISIVARYFDHEKLPQNFHDQIPDLLVNYRYGRGISAPSEYMVMLAAEVLAGHLLADSTFVDGREGKAHASTAGQTAMNLIRQAGQLGFSEWDSPEAFERFVAALAHLTSMAQDEDLRDLAAVLLDKALFLLAANTFKGCFSGTHGSTQAIMLRSAQLEATSGISRLLWGSGANNLHIAGPVSLALSDYEFPNFFGEIADAKSETWSREHHSANGIDVNKVTYRTPDSMLSSVQDFLPGWFGRSEQIWQATLGPDAVIFTTAPANFGNDQAHEPGFWLGNAALPRVAQHKDALVCVYNLPETNWLDFTHAFFPIYELDEFHFEGGWAFGRKGEGYVALRATHGFDLTPTRPDGQRELRSPGRQNVWLCQMGRAETDGNFLQFRESVLALPVDLGSQRAEWTTLRGEKMCFGWEGPLLVEGQEQALGDFPHIDSPYCHVDLPARKMEISYDGIVMQLDFE